MKRLPILLVAAALALLVSIAPALAANRPDTQRLVIIETTDIHGSFFPYDFITDKAVDGSLAQVSTILAQERAKADQQVVYLDNGDNLQGQPSVYYYNFEDFNSTHLLTEIFKYLKPDATIMGNHDIEAGHPVYDKMVKEMPVPMLAANAVRTDNGEPYFKPYTMIERGGVRIAVIGLVTPWIPNWLPSQFWSGMRFDGMAASAQKWMKVVREKENPDIVIGLFHAGMGTGSANDGENGSKYVAMTVPGFDFIFIGHDHNKYNETLTGPDGRTVRIMGAQNACRSIAQAKVDLVLDKATGLYKIDKVDAQVKDIAGTPVDQAFVSAFQKQFDAVKAYVSRPIGKMNGIITTRDSMFGDSAFVDLIHNIQLELTRDDSFGLNKAEISFAAPLSADAQIPTSVDGTLYVRDMFNLYKYENFLYTMNMTGKQIKDFIEFSYAGWFDTMKSADDHIIKFAKNADGTLKLTNGLAEQATRYYNYDSAAGIDYIVDVSKPVGSRVTILGMSNGGAFDLNRTYSVAINSYRAQGGGAHLTTGAGMNAAEVQAMKYVTSSTIKDLRYYIMKWIEKQTAVLEPKPIGNWTVIPTDWAAKAKAQDMPLLYKSNLH